MRLTSFLIVVLLACHVQAVTAQSQLKRPFETRQPLHEEHRALAPPVDWKPALQDAGEKSVTLAVLYSLLLPGMGELYAGNFSSGKYYLIADAGLWLGYGGFQYYGRWLRTDARSYATQHAGANFDSKDEQFEVNIGNFNSVEEYNDARLRDRNFDMLYDPQSSYAWRWEDDASRLQFKDQRIRSDEVFQGARFVVGALVLNRIISAISAGRSASAYNRSLVDESAWRFGADVSGGILQPHGLELKITRRF
jgi:hypothetical protein